MSRPSIAADDFMSVVRGLIRDARELLGEVIRANEARDKRAKAQQTSWTERHRLCVLLDAAEETLMRAPNSAVAPWFLAELSGTLAVVRKWRQTPSWRTIEASLKEKNIYPHAVGLLHVAEHLEMDRYKANIIPEGDQPSPDLMIRAIGGRQDEVALECYQPVALRGQTEPLTREEAAKIVEKSMAKARRQIGLEIPGIIVICGYNQSKANLGVLREAIEERLSKTDRLNLWGFWLMTLGVLFKREGSTFSFTPTRSAEFVRSPAYFGTVDFEIRVPENNPNLIKDQLTDLSTDTLLFGTPDPGLGRADLPSPVTSKKPRKTVPKVIPEPEALTRSVIHGTSNQIPPFFTGTGNLDYSCGRCGALLAQRVWSLSMSDIVLHCPSCKSFNDLPVVAQAGFPAVLLTNGNYNFSKAVILKPGRCVRGGFEPAKQIA